MSNSDGGPAFPFNLMDFHPSTGQQVIREQIEGLSKRDLFAIAALIGETSSQNITRWNEEALAKQCYKTADEMIKARKQ